MDAKMRKLVLAKWVAVECQAKIKKNHSFLKYIGMMGQCPLHPSPCYNWAGMFIAGVENTCANNFCCVNVRTSDRVCNCSSFLVM
jgi:hypothetical protein